MHDLQVDIDGFHLSDKFPARTALQNVFILLKVSVWLMLKLWSSNFLLHIENGVRFCVDISFLFQLSITFPSLVIARSIVYPSFQDFYDSSLTFKIYLIFL